MHKGFVILISSKETMQPIGKQTSPTLMKGINEVMRSSCTEQKVTQRASYMKWFLTNLMCTLNDMLHKPWQVQTVSHTAWHQKN